MFALKSLIDIADHLKSGGCNLTNDWDGHGVTKLLIEMRVGKRKNIGVRKSLKPGPFPWSHLPNVFAVDLALNVCCRNHRVLSVVDEQVPLSTHPPNNYRSRYVIKVPDFISEAVALRNMPSLVSSETRKVGVRKVLLSRNGSILKNVPYSQLLPSRIRESKRIWRNIFSKTDKVDTLPVLRDAEIL